MSLQLGIETRAKEEMIGYEPGDALKLQVLDYDEKGGCDDLTSRLVESDAQMMTIILDKLFCRVLTFIQTDLKARLQ